MDSAVLLRFAPGFKNPGHPVVLLHMAVSQ